MVVIADGSVENARPIDGDVFIEITLDVVRQAQFDERPLLALYHVERTFARFMSDRRLYRADD